MSPGRWERIKDLFEAALELPLENQQSFLRKECLGDDEMFSEVERLLEGNNRIGGFLEQPLFGSLADRVLPSGHDELLGGFRILKLIGTGGMGRVYSAYEISNRRQVALKVLNANFSLYKDDVSRFEREAWIGGRLNHPNIVKAYGQGEISGLHYISMELLEGPSLSDDILTTKAQWDQASDTKIRADRVQKMILLFSDVADAVNHVHINGIIHRDIKPQNLLLTDSGSRLLLSDFGLARDESMSHLTRHGDFLGTIRYMSPEQLLKQRNKVDRRTDIWSLGVSLYEAVTCDLPYAAHTEEGYINAVSLSDPLPARARSQVIPKDLETVLMKCLEKDPGKRYQSAAHLRDDLRRLAANQAVMARRPSIVEKLNRFLKRNGKPVVAAAAATLVLGAALLALYFFGSHSSPGQELTIKPFCTFPGGEYEPKFSPDEKRVAFIWNRENERTFSIYVQNIDRTGLRRITADDASEGSPSWSPDGDSIAFVRYGKSLDDSGVFIKSLYGGTEKRIASVYPVEHSVHRHLDWSPDGMYLALSDFIGFGKPAAIFLISVRDGHRVQISDPIPGTPGDTAPLFSPDGTALSFLRFGGSDVDDIYSMPPTGGSVKRLTTDNSFISDYAWMPNLREIVFNSKRSGSLDLWIAPVAGGAPRAVVGAAGGGNFIAVSSKHQLLALSRWAADTNIWRVDPVIGRPDRPRLREIIASTMDDRSAQYSPDGKRIVFRSNQSGTDEIWVADSSGANQIQLTSFDGPLTGTPRWSRDASWVALDSRPSGHSNIFVISANGGTPRQVTTGAGDNVVPSWSADGKSIYFASNRVGDWQIWKAPVEGESSTHPAVQVTHHGGFTAFESPDGNWVYYAKGREVPGLWKIPVNGGEETIVTPELQAGFWGYWAIGNAAVYFVYCDAHDRCAIKSQSLSTDETTILAFLPKEPPYSDSALSMTPDGKSFLYPEVDHAESNIMLGTNFH